MARDNIEVGPKQAGLVAGWFCDAKVAGVLYQVGVIVVPTAHSETDTFGVVRTLAGKVVWQERVPANADPRTILKLAGFSG